jgi:hypothetical protein
MKIYLKREGETSSQLVFIRPVKAPKYFTNGRRGEKRRRASLAAAVQDTSEFSADARARLRSGSAAAVTPLFERRIIFRLRKSTEWALFMGCVP